jgi:hypothetical protein
MPSAPFVPSLPHPVTVRLNAITGANQNRMNTDFLIVIAHALSTPSRNALSFYFFLQNERIGFENYFQKTIRGDPAQRTQNLRE